MLKKWREKRWQKEIERRQNESLEETLARCKKADYVIETGAGGLDFDLTEEQFEALNSLAEREWGFSLKNPNGDCGPDWAYNTAL